MLAGDFNVMPAGLDLYKPGRWLDGARFRPEVRGRDRPRDYAPLRIVLAVCSQRSAPSQGGGDRLAYLAGIGAAAKIGGSRALQQHRFNRPDDGVVRGGVVQVAITQEVEHHRA